MLNVLVAYPYMKADVIELLRENQTQIRFLLDSGAFTAWKAGKQINLDDYCRFIESLPFKPFGYFMLDVIGDPKATMKNYETMLKRGFKPIPIFTRGEHISVLDDYYKTSEVVGIGGLVGTSGNKGFVKGIMTKIGQRKCHWLGFTQTNFIKYYRPYSCDSSTWEFGGRYGCASLFCYKTNSLIKVDKTLYHQNRARFVDLCQQNGFDIYTKEKLFDGGDSVIRNAGAYGYVNFMREIEKQTHTKLFLALTTGLAFKLVLEAYKQRSRR